MVWDASDGYVLLYGGVALGPPPLNRTLILGDTWTYLDGVWTNLSSTVTGNPPALGEGSLGYDPSTQRVILFGGDNVRMNQTNETWSYHASAWTNITSSVGPSPAPRLAAYMVSDTAADEMILFGGQVSFYPQQDTWTFKNGTWTNITSLISTVMPKLVLPMMADDPADHGVLMFGIDSLAGGRYAATTLLFANGTWKNLTSSLGTQPPLVFVGAMHFITSLNGVVVCCGAVANRTGSFVAGVTVTWIYSGGAWHNITVPTHTPYAPNLLPASSVIPGDDAVLIFGGESEVTFNFVTHAYALSSVPSISVNATPSRCDVGGSVTFASSISGGLSPHTYNWSFGDGTNASGSTGSHTYATAGVYAATLTSTDLAGHVSSASVAVEVNEALTASINATPSPATAGSAAVLVAQISGGTAPFTYSWTLGDGSHSSLAVVSHNYGSGSYTVSLVVNDSTGATVSASATLVVNAAPSTSASLTSGIGAGLLAGIIILAILVVVLGVLLARRPKRPTPPSEFTSGPPQPPVSVSGGRIEGPPPP